MKKTLIAVVVILALTIAILFSYNYLLTEKMVEDFLHDLRNEDSFIGHPQQQLLQELIELEISQDLYISSTKKGIRGVSGVIGIKIGAEEFTFNIESEITDSSKRVIMVDGIEIINALVIQKHQEDENFLYLVQIDEREVGFSSPLDLDIEPGDVERFVLMNDKIMALSPLELVNIEKVMFFDGLSITGEREGKFTLSGDLKRYGIEDGLYIGQKNVDLYLKNNLVVALATREEFVPDTIRVLINDTGFNNVYHEEIELYFSERGTMRSLDGTPIDIDANTTIRVRSNGKDTEVNIGGKSHIFNERVYLKTQGKTYFESIKRGAGLNLKPGYRGKFEIYTNDSKLYLINELSLEEYLYGVVPSEMPVNFGLAALEIQSMAARTYAVNNIYVSNFRNYSAHVVDSVSSQVYNNTSEYDLTSKSVDNTTGKVIKYENKVIDAKFFSTSSGYTAKANEVWEMGGQFPGPEIPYLRSKAQGMTSRYNIGNEKSFESFIKDESIISFDSEAPFYRWTIHMSEEQLRKSIEENLRARFSAQPNSVLTLDGGEYISKEISDSPLGELKELVVVQRGQGGNIMILDIIGENGTYRIEKEYNIRFTLRPVCTINPVKILRQDGSVLTNYSILPSAFIHLEQIYHEDKLAEIIIYGGGNGHGAGMSQYGVRGMLNAGYSQDEIIRHYYEGTEIKKLY